MKLQNTLFILTVFFSHTVFSAYYGIGDKLNALSLEDQYEKSGSINNKTQLILFSRDKTGGEMLIEALVNMPGGFLVERNIVYISDISDMPSLIFNYIVLPSLQKKNYSILLDKEGEHTGDFPDQDGMATLIYIESLTIVNIIYFNSMDKIKESLLKL